ncbi:hypothetical protein QBC35DRAFT_2611 [Podospora australis]|uniref:Uncharacterized protein n=1 Tax=Podospora australis TaxID=1536484 RepID=A0AAN6X697_9PEZI|nr:hypothetical protein QBC35DRAFT_2611 [Podospora australis]
MIGTMGTGTTAGIFFLLFVKVHFFLSFGLYRKMCWETLLQLLVITFFPPSLPGLTRKSWRLSGGRRRARVSPEAAELSTNIKDESINYSKQLPAPCRVFFCLLMLFFSPVIARLAFLSEEI